jgi:antitoxin component of MazEF toxin-antitoxin module
MGDVLSKSGFPLYTSRVRRWGGSIVLVLPPAVYERLLLIEGSVVAMRIHEPFLTLRAFPPPTIPDPYTLSKEILPPAVEEVRRHG